MKSTDALRAIANTLDKAHAETKDTFRTFVEYVADEAVKAARAKMTNFESITADSRLIRSAATDVEGVRRTR